MCNGDYERDLKIICFDWNLSDDHSLIGEFHTNLKSLLSPKASFKCINGKKKVNCCSFNEIFNYDNLYLSKYSQEKKKNYKDSGEIRVDYIKIQPKYTFLDYVQGGTEIFCTVAIDFTGKIC